MAIQKTYNDWEDRQNCPEVDAVSFRVSKYAVWQKSNETDFILTVNSILFANQVYPLQNSSLGQLHSDGGVVSIVRSSAGRHLLV